jgi:adenylate kinase family enzyme
MFAVLPLTDPVAVRTRGPIGTVVAVQRVAIVGSPGSGKSTLADLLSASTGLRRVELDALWHRPGWTNPPVPEFRRAVAEQLASGTWVVDGNYRMVQDIVHGSADTIVWLDLPRWRVTMRVTRRSLWRVLTGKRLWAGNRERLGTLFSRDPAENMVAWTWTQYPKYRALYSTLAHDGTWGHAAVWHLRTTGDVRHLRRWVADHAP